MASDAAYLTVRRVPVETHSAIARLAKANRRSINAEVLIAIEAHIANAQNIDEQMRISQAIRVTRTEQKNRIVEVRPRDSRKGRGKGRKS